ncbi:MAG: hypothetical protein ACOY33_09395 [Pseudomonadota bacterium]
MRMSNVVAGVLAAVAGLSCFSAPALAASGAALARDVVVQVHEVGMEVSMMVYDESSEIYRRQARARLDGLDAPMKQVLAELGTRDAAQAAAATEYWRMIQGSLKGGRDFGAGILNTGYEAKIHGDFDASSQQLTDLLTKAWKLLEKNNAPEARAELLAAKIVSNYVQISGSPFGSFTLSSNTDDSDLAKGVAQLDALLAELAVKYEKDKEKLAKLKRIGAKWQFIRTTILKAGSQATPYIVYKHGGDIMRELATLR